MRSKPEFKPEPPAPGSSDAARIAQLTEALRDSEERFRAIVQQSGVGIVQVHLDGCISMCNSVFVRMLGYEQAEPLLGTSFRELTPVEDLAAEEPMIAQVLAGQRDHYNIRKRMFRRDRSTIWVQVNSSVLRDAQGQLSGAVGVIQDVSEEVAAEIALRDSQRFLERITQTSPAVHYLFDVTQKRTVFVNRSLTDLLGYPPQHVGSNGGIQPTFIMHPEDLERLPAHWRMLEELPDGQSLGLEYRLRHADGSYRWFQARDIVFQRDTQGRVQQILGTAFDVTEQKRATEDSQQRDLRLRLAMDAAELGSWSFDPATGMVDWDANHRRIYRGVADNTPITLDQFLNQIVHPDDRSKLTDRVNRAIDPSGDGRYEFDYRIIHPNGQIRHVTSRGQSTFKEIDGKKVCVQFIGTSQDITRRVQSENALRESEERFRTMADGLPIIVWVHDAQGDLQFINRTYCEFFGVTPEQVTGSNWVPLIHPDDAKRYADEFLACMRERRVFRAQARVRRADGQWRWVDSHARPRFAADGTFLGFIGASPDITESKHTEEAQRELNQTLERRVAERTAQARLQAEQLRVLASELTQAEQRERERLAQVLHDDLQQLIVAARMQLAGLGSTTDAQALNDSVKQIDDLLVQVMQCSRNLTVDLAPLALQENTFLGALEWLAGHMQQRHGLNVTVDGMESVEPDNPQLRTHVFNAARELLFNVVKHANARNVDMRLDYDEQDRLRLTVQDDGQGFDPQHLPDRHDGGGFGLFSVRERLSLFGGELHIESHPGQGTRVVLIAPALPINEPEEIHAPQELTSTTPADSGSAPDPSQRSIRVLLADDHQVVRDGLSSLIESQPDLIMVGQASDGEQAVQQARDLQPDVVVLDVTMPRLNGIDVARILRKDMPQVRIIGLSMHDDPHISASMRSAGAAVFLTKDCPSHLLLAAIREGVTV